MAVSEKDAAAPEETPEANTITLTEEELDARIQAAIDKRDAAHAKELAAVRATFPSAQVPQNAGGPGVDNHKPSWSLVEQELAQAGEWLEHWGDRPE